MTDRGISANDCLLLSLRKYELPQAYREIYAPHTYSYPMDILREENARLWQWGRLVKSYGNLSRLERFIQDHFGQDVFLFYLPNAFQTDAASGIVTMKGCKGFYILEEGSASYCEEKELSQLFVGWQRKVYDYILNPLFPRFYCMRGSFYSTDHKLFKGTIAMTKEAFSSVGGEKIVVSCPFVDESLDRAPDAVLSVDATLNMFFSAEVAEEVYRRLKEEMASRGLLTLAYKFHPNYYGNEELLAHYRGILQSVFGDDAYEMNASSVMENVLCSYKCYFYSDLSSVAWYASKFGAKCYSYAKWLCEKDQRYAQKMRPVIDKLEGIYTFL